VKPQNKQKSDGGQKPYFARVGAFAVIALAILAVASTARPSASSPTDSPAVRTAQQQFNSGNYSGAIQTLTSAQDPSNPAVSYWLGRSYYELHDVDNAVENLEKAVSLDPKNSAYHQWLGQAYGDKADREHSFSVAKKVKKEFQQAVELDPSNIPARRDLEEYCLDAPWIVGGNKDEALEQVNAIAMQDPVQGHLARGLYDLEALKKPAQAEDEYHQALAANPKNLDVYFDVAGFFASQNKPADLNSTIQAASQVNPSDPRLAYFRGVADVLGNTDLDAAEQNLKSYLARTPERSDWPSHASARLWLGKLYEAQNKTSDAAEQYRAALQIDPGLKEAKTRLDKLEKSQ
jgi:tetratricopeptide (TPR) repeat protein